MGRIENVNDIREAAQVIHDLGAKMVAEGVVIKYEDEHGEGEINEPWAKSMVTMLHNETNLILNKLIKKYAPAIAAGAIMLSAAEAARTVCNTQDEIDKAVQNSTEQQA